MLIEPFWGFKHLLPDVKIFPFLGGLGSCRKSDLPKDLIAEPNVTVLLTPQGMAYVMIVDLPPEYGIYKALYLKIAKTNP